MVVGEGASGEALIPITDKDIHAVKLSATFSGILEIPVALHPPNGLPPFALLTAKGVEESNERLRVVQRRLGEVMQLCGGVQFLEPVEIDRDEFWDAGQNSVILWGVWIGVGHK